MAVESDPDKLSEGSSPGTSSTYSSDGSTTRYYLRKTKNNSSPDLSSDEERRDGLNLSNGYAALSDIEEREAEENDDSSNADEEAQPDIQEHAPTPPRSGKPPPPLIFNESQRDKHKVLVKRAQDYTEKFHIVHRQDNTALYFEDEKHKNGFVRDFNHAYDMHTYASKTNAQKRSSCEECPLISPQKRSKMMRKN